MVSLAKIYAMGPRLTTKKESHIRRILGLIKSIIIYLKIR
jgi:hypothetical protein